MVLHLPICVCLFLLLGIAMASFDIRYLYLMTKLSKLKEALVQLKFTCCDLVSSFVFIRIWALVVIVSSLLVYLLAMDMLGDNPGIANYMFK